MTQNIYINRLQLEAEVKQTLHPKIKVIELQQKFQHLWELIRILILVT